MESSPMTWLATMRHEQRWRSGLQHVASCVSLHLEAWDNTKTDALKEAGRSLIVQHFWLHLSGQERAKAVDLEDEKNVRNEEAASKDQPNCCRILSTVSRICLSTGAVAAGTPQKDRKAL